MIWLFLLFLDTFGKGFGRLIGQPGPSDGYDDNDETDNDVNVVDVNISWLFYDALIRRQLFCPTP